MAGGPAPEAAGVVVISTTRQRLLFLIPTLTGGGAERVIVTLLMHLDRARFDLALAVVDMRGAAYLHDIPHDVEFIDLQCTRVRDAVPKIIRLIWNRRPHIVFSTLSHLNLALAISRPLLPNNVRYVARETSIVSCTINSQQHRAWRRWAYRRFYPRFDLLVCQSHYMRDDLVAHFAYPQGKTVVIHNPIDIDRVRTLAGESASAADSCAAATGMPTGPVVRLVAAGRMVHVKGFDLLLEAMARSGNATLRLTLLGEGPLRPRLEAMAVGLGLAPRVHFAGYLRNPYPCIAQADAFVLSSRYEGFPNVALDALACMTPVIAIRSPGGAMELLEGVPGCVVTANPTADGLADVLRDLSWLRRLDADAAARYAVQKITGQYANALHQLRGANR